MRRGELIVIGIALGILAGVMHADAVSARQIPQHEEVRAEFNADVVLDLRYQEWRRHQIYVIATVIMSENGHKNPDCMQATGQTVTNRLRDGRWGSTIDEVVNYPNAYATNQEPNEECLAVAEWVLDHPDVFPANMFYFKEGSYRSWATDYTQIDGTCFSTEGVARWEN